MRSNRFSARTAIGSIALVAAIGAIAVGVTAAVGSTGQSDSGDKTAWETVHSGIDLTSSRDIGTRHRSGDTVVFTQYYDVVTLNTATGAVSTTAMSALLGVDRSWSVYATLRHANSVWIVDISGYKEENRHIVEFRDARATSTNGYDWQTSEGRDQVVPAGDGFATVSNDFITMLDDGESIPTPWGDDFNLDGQVGTGDRIDVLGARTSPDDVLKVWSLTNGSWSSTPALIDSIGKIDFFVTGNRTWVLGANFRDPLYVAWSSEDGVNWTQHGLVGVTIGGGASLHLIYADDDSFLALLDRCSQSYDCTDEQQQSLLIRGDSTGISVLSPLSDDSEPAARRLFIGDDDQTITVIRQTERGADINIQTQPLPNAADYTTTSSPTGN